MQNRMNNKLYPLNQFIAEMTKLLSVSRTEELILAEGKLLLGSLISSDEWLPPDYATPLPNKYAQYLIYCDPSERFSIVSFVWGPGQSTPIHNHTVWGIVGGMRHG